MTAFEIFAIIAQSRCSSHVRSGAIFEAQAALGTANSFRTALPVRTLSADRWSGRAIMERDYGADA